MRVSSLASAFNGLTQLSASRIVDTEHIASVELAISPQAMEEAVALFRPDIIRVHF